MRRPGPRSRNGRRTAASRRHRSSIPRSRGAEGRQRDRVRGLAAEPAAERPLRQPRPRPATTFAEGGDAQRLKPSARATCSTRRQANGQRPEIVCRAGSASTAVFGGSPAGGIELARPSCAATGTAAAASIFGGARAAAAVPRNQGAASGRGVSASQRRQADSVISMALKIELEQVGRENAQLLNPTVRIRMPIKCCT